MNKIKKQIRFFSLWIDRITCNWVVPEEVWIEMDRNNIKFCEEFIAKNAKDWEEGGVDDPEIVRLKALIFMWEGG